MGWFTLLGFVSYRQGEEIEFADGDFVYVASSVASGTIIYTIIIEILVYMADGRVYTIIFSLLP